MRNPSLQGLDALVWTWDLTLSGAWFLESMEVEQHGRAVLRWLGEAFRLRTQREAWTCTTGPSCGRTATASRAGPTRPTTAHGRGARTPTCTSGGADPQGPERRGARGR